MEDNKTVPAALYCEFCGQPGEPSWGGTVLCESCYGNIGATCAGRPTKPQDKKPTIDIGPVC